MLPTWTRDGEYLAFRSGNALAWKRSDGSGKTEYLAGVSPNAGPWSFSADGKWLAFWPLEDGRFEIYVMPFSPQGRAVGQKWLVSNGGGTGPIWSHNGRELFYQSLDRRIGVAAYAVRGDSFVAEKARHWSETRLVDTGYFSSFDVARDGKHVVAMFAAEDSRAATLVRVLLHVDGELRRRLPAFAR